MCVCVCAYVCVRVCMYIRPLKGHVHPLVVNPKSMSRPTRLIKEGDQLCGSVYGYHASKRSFGSL